MPFRLFCVTVLTFAGASFVSAEDATTAVTLRDLTLQVPKSWKEAKSSSSMRLATYEIPPVKGDPESGELTVFSFAGGGGGVGANIERWIGQFDGKGRTSTVTKGKAGDNVYYLADIAGTYNKPDGPPFLRKTKPAPGYRMLAAIIQLEGKGVYYLKLAGPDATIKAELEPFRKSFGGDKETEEPFEL